MSYWHAFKKKGKKPNEPRHELLGQRVDGGGSAPAETPDGDPRPDVEHTDAVGSEGDVVAVQEAPVATPIPRKPPTFEEKALALADFDIEYEAAELSKFVAYEMSHLVYLTPAQQHIFYAHFREVLRRCASTHLHLHPQ